MVIEKFPSYPTSEVLKAVKTVNVSICYDLCMHTEHKRFHIHAYRHEKVSIGTCIYIQVYKGLLFCEGRTGS
jgi:hypothetical protein